MQVFQLTAQKGDSLWVGRYGVRFTPDGRYLYVPANTRNFLDTLGDQPPGALHHLHGFARDGSLSVAWANGFLVVTDLRTGKQELNEQKDCMISDGVVSADGERLYLALYLPFQAGAGRESEIRVLSADSLQLRYTLGRQQLPLYRVAVSTSGDRLAVQGNDGLKVWEVPSAKPEGFVATETPPVEPLFSVLRPQRWVSDFALSNDGTRLVTVDSAAVTIWNVEGGEQVVRSGKHRRGVTAVACSPTKPLLTTGDNAGNVFLWDFTGRVLSRFDWKLGEVYGLAFAPDGLRCAAVDKVGKVVVWDVDA